MGSRQIPIIIDYFKSLGVYTLSLLLCFSEELKTTTLQQMSAEGFQVNFNLTTNTAGTALDLSCNKQIVDQIEGLWLLFGSAEDAAKLPVLPDSSVILVGEEDILLDIYKPSKSSPLRVTNFTGLRDHSDFGGVTLEAVTVDNKKITGYGSDAANEDVFGEYGCLSKQPGGWSPLMSEVLVDNLARQLNFKLTKKIVPDCKSLYKELSHGNFTFSSTAVMMTSRRMDYSYFTGDLYEHKTMILYKHPRLSVISNIYLQPFQRNVWLCCIALFLICFALLITAMLVYPGSFEDYTYTGPLDVLTLLVAVATQQGILYLLAGINLGASSICTRMSLLLFSICSLFLYTSYSANIVALLQDSAETVASIVQLTASPLKLFVQDRPYNKIYIRESDGEIKELYEKKITQENNDPYISAEKGIEKIRSELFAFQVESSLAYQLMSKTYTSKEKCGLGELHLYTFPRFSIPVSKHSGYRELFTSRLSRQREYGLIKWAEHKSLEGKPSCIATDSGFISVTLGDFLPGLLVITWGVAAAISGLLAEVLTARCSQANQFDQKKEK